MRFQLRILIPAVFTLFMSGAAVSFSAPLPQKLIDPPAAPGALGPSLTLAGNDVLLTWLEPAGQGHRLRFSRLSGDR